MKMLKMLFIGLLPITLSVLTGCSRHPNNFWDDTRSAGRHMTRGFRTLGGKHGDSRQICSRDEFMPSNYGNGCDEFVPLCDDPNASEFSMADMPARSPRECPGEPGSTIPGIQAFRDPSNNPRLAGIFRHLHFAYNSSLVKGQEDLGTIQKVSSYMKQHPNAYIFIEGHCDERGPEAFNFALGANRSNSVRSLLINEGASPDNIFTISYGKDRPLVVGHDEEAWQQNRRAEFKIYER